MSSFAAEAEGGCQDPGKTRHDLPLAHTSLVTLDSSGSSRRLEDEYLTVSYRALRGRLSVLRLAWMMDEALAPSRHGVHRSLTLTPAQPAAQIRPDPLMHPSPPGLPHFGHA
jgi:hypothetical protein